MGLWQEGLTEVIEHYELLRTLVSADGNLLGICKQLNISDLTRKMFGWWSFKFPTCHKPCSLCVIIESKTYEPNRKTFRSSNTTEQERK